MSTEGIDITKKGFFYRVQGCGAYALHAVTGLKLKNNRVFFNIEYIDKVLELLEKYQLSYTVSDDGRVSKSFKGKDNNYNFFLALGRDINSLNTHISKENRQIKKKLLNQNIL